MTDLDQEAADVRAFWQGLGLPGLFDAHAHFLPPVIQRAVWAVFDRAGPKIGREWPIRYRQSHQERVEILRSFGVRRFSTLPYAHKPGVATFLNDWSRDFAREVPEVLWSATFFPEPEAAAYVAELVGEGVEVFKVHVQVGEFDLGDPALDEVWGLLSDSGTPVVIHAGSGPVGNEFTGPDPLRRVLERHPRLSVVIAHLGAPEFAEFIELAETYEHVCLDTTMVFTDFFIPFPAELRPRLADLPHKVLLGSDFPTIPYPYVHQLESIARLDLGDDWVRAVCWDNGVRLFGAPGG
jgi:predicted TIM-barrel fold metal-dependent hydrolase